jgi:ribosomal protein S18 acetylase RimI-like enzyme
VNRPETRLDTYPIPGEELSHGSTARVLPTTNGQILEREAMWTGALYHLGGALANVLDGLSLYWYSGHGMSKGTGTIVRAFDGSLADVMGLLEVERATFNESPYGAEDVRAMLSTGPQRAWLAIARDKVVGFVIAFPTHGLSGGRWEIDVLAVHPHCSGRGLGTRLIRTAAAHGVGVARRARAVVATDNPASARAFTRAGFRQARGTYDLLIYRTQGLSPRPAAARGVTVREATCVAEEEEWLAAFPAPSAAPLVPGELRSHSTTGLSRRADPSRPGPEEQAAAHQVGHVSPGRTLLLAEQAGQPAGYAELVPVQTLLYCGEWIETLVAPAKAARDALVHAAANRAETADLDEVGAMVPEDNRLLQQALLSGGFRSFGEFHWLVAELPLPGWAAFPSPSLTSGDTSDGDHV